MQLLLLRYTLRAVFTAVTLTQRQTSCCSRRSKIVLPLFDWQERAKADP